MERRYKAILFDLDGTVANTEEGVTRSVQYALEQLGIREPDRSSLRRFIGPPLNLSFEKFYGFSKEQTAQAVSAYRERYARTGIFECAIYPGIPEALRTLREHGCVIALASSKPETFCRQILEHFSLEGCFDEIVGASMDGRINTKREVLEELARRFADRQIDKDEMCLIGDTRYDVLGAREFGISCIAVSYGAEARESLETYEPMCICDTVEEAVQVILSYMPVADRCDTCVCLHAQIK